MTQQARFWWTLSAVSGLALVAVALIATQIFEQLPHSEDEVAYLFQANIFARQRLAAPTPSLPDAFWSPFVVDYQGQRFGKYPPGWPLLLSAGVWLGQPWLVNALLGSITLFLIGWLGRCYYAAQEPAGYTALLAAGLGLATPAFLFQSAALLSHAASLFWNTLALLALYYALTTPQRTSLYFGLTGVCLGAAFITRPFAAVSIGLAIAIFLLARLTQQRLGWRPLLWLLLGGAITTSLLPLYWWLVAGQPTFNAYLLVWPYDRPGFGPNIGPHGYTLSDALFINTRLKLTTLAAGLFGWPGWLNLLFLPVPFVARRANRWDWLLLSTIGAAIVVHIFYWAFGGADGGLPRYYYDALPAFLLLTARGVMVTAHWLSRWHKAGGWLLLALVAALVGYNLTWNLPPLLTAQQQKYGITAAPLHAVKAADLPTPALVLVQNVDSWADFAAHFSANSPLLDGPIVYAIAWNDAYAQALRAQFPHRSCWELTGVTLSPCSSPQKP